MDTQSCGMLAKLHNCDLRDAKDLKESLRGPISDTVPFLYLGIHDMPSLAHVFSPWMSAMYQQNAK